MKVSILTVGTRGDVQPYVALGQGLRSLGWDVVLATSRRFESFVRENGLNFAPLRADYVELMDSSENNPLASRNPLQMMRDVRSKVFPMMRQMLDDTWDAARDADLIVYHPKALAGVHLAERLDIPCIVAPVVPMLVPTRDFPAPGLNFNPGRLFNRATYGLIAKGTMMFQGLIDEWRRETLGLGAVPRNAGMYTVRGEPVPIVHGVSEHVVPRPTDWPDHAVMTGYWIREQTDWQPPGDLEEFLRAGDPPIYIGFGSLSPTQSESLSRTIIEAVRQVGTRAVVVFGPHISEDFLRSLPDTVYVLGRAPHTWLFPRMAAVVHHGGAGTVAAGLLSGQPTVICPFMTDQPFWGERIFRLGVGPRPIPAKKITVDRLASALHTTLHDSDMIRRARELGERLRREDGIDRAVAYIRDYVQRG